MHSSHQDKFAAASRLLAGTPLLPAALAWNLLLAIWLLCHAADAGASLQVSVEAVQASDAYRVTRRYAGTTSVRRSSALGFRQSGRLGRVLVDDGEVVTSGQLLAELDDDLLQVELQEARAEQARSRAALDMARADLELALETRTRHEDLLRRGHTSAQRFDEVRLALEARQAGLAVAEAQLASATARARRAEVELDKATIRAPYDAIVQQRLADEGTMLGPGQTVMRIVEADRMEARIGLPADVASTLDTGSVHSFESGAGTLGGRVLHRLPEVDPSTRTVTVLFELDVTPRQLPGGSMIELILERSVDERGFWLPLAALSEAQRGLWGVYVVMPGAAGQVTERRLVEVIHTEGDRVYVRGTLADGDLVVRTGTQRIVPGQAVEAVAAAD